MDVHDSWYLADISDLVGLIGPHHTPTIESREEVQVGVAGKIPKTRKTVKKMVMNLAKERKLVTSEVLQSLLAKGEHFSLTLDEATSSRTKARVWCLRKARISGSLPAKRAIPSLHVIWVESLSASPQVLLLRCKDEQQLLKSDHCECHGYGVDLAVCYALCRKASR